MTLEYSSNKLPLVSVVVPVYKVEDYLASCISSVLAQTYKNIEIILVDDGSPDSCPAICDSYAELYESVRVLHKQNGGLSDARNRGLEEATGDYVLFLDSDDTLPEYAIEHLLNVAVAEGCDIVVPDRYFKVWPGGKKNLCHHFPIEMEDADPRRFAKSVLIRHARACRASALLYARQTLSVSGACFPVGRISEDFPFNLQVFGTARKLGFLHESTVNYLQRPGSITSSFQPDYFDTILYLDDCARAFLSEKNIATGGSPEADILLCRNVVVYLASAYSKSSRITKKERDDLFAKITYHPRVQKALEVQFENLLFSSRFAGEFCVRVKKLLESGAYSRAKALLYLAGRR